MIFGMLKSALRGPMSAIKTAWGPAGFGVTALGGAGSRLIGPALLMGGFGALVAGRNLLGAPYSMHGERAAWGYTPGMSEPYERNPMEFTGIPRKLDMGARGSMLFAMHNQRKR